jgi:hypothetical protein
VKKCDAGSVDLPAKRRIKRRPEADSTGTPARRMPRVVLSGSVSDTARNLRRERNLPRLKRFRPNSTVRLEGVILTDLPASGLLSGSI